MAKHMIVQLQCLSGPITCQLLSIHFMATTATSILSGKISVSKAVETLDEKECLDVIRLVPEELQ